ncbi:putative DNA repair RAD52-like protein [Helianthus annuus]|nr:putative DNA repair RAD52-like protein [Helianthus annuus]
MAFCLLKSLTRKSSLPAALRLRSPEIIGTFCIQTLPYSTKRVKKEETVTADEITAYGVPLSRPISEILKELNKKVPDSLIRTRTESDGFTLKHLPWLISLSTSEPRVSGY